MASKIKPAPVAKPMAAQIQRVVAVLKPLTVNLSLIMTPAPKKPTPETVAAPIRETS